MLRQSATGVPCTNAPLAIWSARKAAVGGCGGRRESATSIAGTSASIAATISASA